MCQNVGPRRPKETRLEPLLPLFGVGDDRPLRWLQHVWLRRRVRRYRLLLMLNGSRLRRVVWDR